MSEEETEFSFLRLLHSLFLVTPLFSLYLAFFLLLLPRLLLPLCSSRKQALLESSEDKRAAATTKKDNNRTNGLRTDFAGRRL